MCLQCIVGQPWVDAVAGMLVGAYHAGTSMHLTCTEADFTSTPGISNWGILMSCNTYQVVTASITISLCQLTCETPDSLGLTPAI